MSDQWMINAREFTNCNCPYGCPCQFNTPAPSGFCEAIGSIIIDEGHYNDTRLDGVKFVLLYKWPGQIAEGNGQMQLIVDEAASEEQVEAVRKIAYGETTEPGTTHFFIFNSTCSKVHDMLIKPIEMEIDINTRKASTKVEGLVESAGTPLINPFNKKEVRKVIHLPEGFEFTNAEVASGKSKVSSAFELNFDNTHGHFCILHMNQNGVVREQQKQTVA